MSLIAHWKRKADACALRHQAGEGTLFTATGSQLADLAFLLGDENHWNVSDEKYRAHLFITLDHKLDGLRLQWDDAGDISAELERYAMLLGTKREIVGNEPHFDVSKGWHEESDHELFTRIANMVLDQLVLIGED